MSDEPFDSWWAGVLKVDRRLTMRRRLKLTACTILVLVAIGLVGKIAFPDAFRSYFCP